MTPIYLLFSVISSFNHSNIIIFLFVLLHNFSPLQMVLEQYNLRESKLLTFFCFKKKYAKDVVGSPILNMKEFKNNFDEITRRLSTRLSEDIWRIIVRTMRLRSTKPYMFACLSSLSLWICLVDSPSLEYVFNRRFGQSISISPQLNPIIDFSL